MAGSIFNYVSYIRTTPEKLWSALTVDAELMKQYWFGNHCQSGWAVGSAWRNISAEGRVTDVGDIIEADVPRRLVIRWHHANRPELQAEGESRCTMELQPTGTAVRLTLTHSMERERSLLVAAVSEGWPKVISNLKSLLEHGSIALQQSRCAVGPETPKQ